MTEKKMWVDRLSPVLNTQADIIREREAFFNRIKETFFRTWDLAVREDVAKSWGLRLPAPPSAPAWKSMPERGWLVLDAEPHRPYVVSIWQIGKWLRIGAKLQPQMFVNAGLHEAISSLFYDAPCHLTVRGNEYLFDWQFEVPDLYRDIVEQETWILALLHLYEMVDNLILDLGHQPEPGRA